MVTSPFGPQAAHATCVGLTERTAATALPSQAVYVIGSLALIVFLALATAVAGTVATLSFVDEVPQLEEPAAETPAAL